MATVRIRRDTSPFNDRLRAYRVVVDSRELGRLGWAQTIDLPVELGAHQLCVRIDWTGSPTVPFSISAGEVAEFVCRSRRPALWGTLAVIQSIWRRDNWLTLQRT
jgi:hypothetical protein